MVGDAVNYWIGYKVGPKVFASEGSRLLNKKHLLEAQRFYDKYGNMTIVLARFVPIVRTFAPFVAGVGRMDYGRFFLFNVTGGISWVLICLFGGWFFGSWPFVQKNFELVDKVKEIADEKGVKPGQIALAWVLAQGNDIALRQAFIQPDRANASQTLRHVADQIRTRWPKLGAFIDESEADVLTHMDFPAQHRSKIHSTNPLERLNILHDVRGGRSADAGR